MAPSSYQPPLNINLRYTRSVSDSEIRTQRSGFPTGSSSAQPGTPTSNPPHHHTTTDNDSSSDDDVRIISSRSSVSARKDPVSEVTKQEMRQLAKEEANKGKVKDNATSQAQVKSQGNPGG